MARVKLDQTMYSSLIIILEIKDLYAGLHNRIHSVVTVRVNFSIRAIFCTLSQTGRSIKCAGVCAFMSVSDGRECVEE